MKKEEEREGKMSDALSLNGLTLRVEEAFPEEENIECDLFKMLHYFHTNTLACPVQ